MVQTGTAAARVRGVSVAAGTRSAVTPPREPSSRQRWAACLPGAVVGNSPGMVLLPCSGTPVVSAAARVRPARSSWLDLSATSPSLGCGSCYFAESVLSLPDESTQDQENTSQIFG